MRIVVNTTTFPSSPSDPVPRFVLEQIQAMSILNPKLKFDVLIPHNSYNEQVSSVIQAPTHREFRYHYVWPRKFEKLTGRGILPALNENWLRFFLIPFHLWGQYRALCKMCDQAKPDLVYAHWFMSPAIVSYFVCRNRKIPLVFTTHASDVSVLAKIPGAKCLIQKVLNYSIGFTAVSNRTANKLKAFFNDYEWDSQFARKLSILPMGTDLNMPDVSEDRRLRILKSAGLQANQSFILCMGRLSDKKGFKYLIRAFAKLNYCELGVEKLVVAGDGQILEELQAEVQSLSIQDRVIFTGYVSGDLKDVLLSSADLFVLPSIVDETGDSEGLPVVLMEALARSRRVVATNVSGAEEVLNENSGVLVEQKSADAIAEAMQAMLIQSKMERKLMESEARKLSFQFGWPAIAAQYVEILINAADHA